TVEDELEEDTDYEYENEELVEASLYYSDTFDSDSDNDLEYNPWMDLHSPDYSENEQKNDNEEEGNTSLPICRPELEYRAFQHCSIGNFESINRNKSELLVVVLMAKN
ncbi:hypothetical protein RhiirA4_478403, partial [Rhizophagus irregularis]